MNAERAQTSIAARLPNNETILFDASSGTILLGRLETAGIPLEEIHNLFVSHQHFDHVGGLVPLLISMASLPEAFLILFRAIDIILFRAIDVTTPPPPPPTMSNR